MASQQVWTILDEAVPAATGTLYSGIMPVGEYNRITVRIVNSYTGGSLRWKVEGDTDPLFGNPIPVRAETAAPVGASDYSDQVRYPYVRVVVEVVELPTAGTVRVDLVGIKDT